MLISNTKITKLPKTHLMPKTQQKLLKTHPWSIWIGQTQLSQWGCHCCKLQDQSTIAFLQKICCSLHLLNRVPNM